MHGQSETYLVLALLLGPRVPLRAACRGHRVTEARLRRWPYGGAHTQVLTFLVQEAGLARCVVADRGLLEQAIQRKLVVVARPVRDSVLCVLRARQAKRRRDSANL